MSKLPFPTNRLRFGSVLLVVLLGVTACKGKSNTLASMNGKGVKQEEFDAYLALKHISPTDQKRRDRALDEYLERAALAQVIEKEPNFDRAAIEAEVAEFRREAVLSRYFDRFLDQKVTDAAVKNYFDANAKNYEQRKVHAAHILVRTNSKMSDEERKAKRTTAEELYAKLQTGQSFEEIARTLSEDRISGAKGGDLGWLREGSIAPEFSQRAFSMKAGSVSEPFETQFGFHIVKLLEEPKVVRKPYAAAVGDIRYQLRAEAKEAELQRLKAKVKIEKKNPYRLDSKASAASSARPGEPRRSLGAPGPTPPAAPEPAPPVLELAADSGLRADVPVTSAVPRPAGSVAPALRPRQSAPATSSP